MNAFKWARGAAVAAAAFAISTGALAADTGKKPASSTAEDVPALEEVIVTAQRREERLQDVPVAMSVTTAEQIQRDQINSLNDLQRISAAVEVNRTFGGETSGGGRIRGLGTTSFSGVGAVAFVIDGVPQGDVAQVNIFDIGQIEVLRGPQGTLFGQTASAGVINQVTVAPNPEKMTASVHADFSNKGTFGSDFGRHNIRGTWNLPLTDSSALRLASFVTHTIGSQHNTATNHDNNFTDAGIRVRYLAKPTDSLEVNLIGDFTFSKQHGIDFFTAAIAPSSPTSGDNALLAACGIKADYGNQNYCYPIEDSTSSHNYGLSAKLDWKINELTLTSVSAWRRADQKVIQSTISRTKASAQSFPIPDIFSRNTNNGRNQFVQELRLTSPSGEKIEYVTGLYYASSFNKPGVGPGGGGFNLRFPWPATAPQCVFGGACSIVDAFTPSTSKATTKAVFGDITFHVTDELRIFGGLRYTRQELDNTVAAVRAVTTDTNTSGRLGAAYKFNADHMVYTSVASGYKSPFLQVNANPAVAPNVIKGEKPRAVELGYKGSYLDNRLGLDVNVFHVDVKDYQGQQCSVNPVNAALQCLSVNIPSVKSKGIEIDLLGNPFKGLRLNGGFIYNSVTYPNNWLGSDASHGGIYSNISGQQLALAPKYKLTLSAEFSRAMASGSEGFVSLNPVYKSKIRFNDSTNPVYDYKAHWQLGATVGLRAADNRWSVSVFGRNIFGEHEPVVIFGNDTGGALMGWPFADVTLRQVGLSFDVKL
jgi:iron complex outermembrane recepter protein